MTMKLKLFIYILLFVFSFITTETLTAETIDLPGLDTIKTVKAKIDFLNETALEAINNDPEIAKSYAISGSLFMASKAVSKP